jgi:hypothetical protein
LTCQGQAAKDKAKINNVSVTYNPTDLLIIHLPTILICQEQANSPTGILNLTMFNRTGPREREKL